MHPYHGLNELREMFLSFFETRGASPAQDLHLPEVHPHRRY